jgi:hypothetical protein
MAEPTDKVLKDIIATSNLAQVEQLRRYLIYYRDEYSSLDFMKLLDAIIDKEERYTPRCPTRLSFRIFEDGIEYNLTPTAKESGWVCENSLEQGVPQLELWFQLYPKLREHATEIYPTAHIERPAIAPASTQETEEERMMRHRQNARKAHERFKRIGLLPGEEERPREEINVEMHPEEIETIRAYEEMERKLHEQQKPPEQEYVTTLTAKEYSAFQKFRKELDDLKPYVYHQPGENYEIRIKYSSDAEKALIDGIILKAREGGKYTKRQPNPKGHTKWADELCKIFEAETGNPCGISRYGAISSLVDMIDGYIQERTGGQHELDPALLEKYISEIELFARKGQKVYTNEQAQEAFATFVRNVENSGLSMEEAMSGPRTRIPDMCEPDVIYPTFVDVYVYLEKLRLHKATDRDKKDYDKAMDLLTKCGYTPSKYGEYLAEAKAYFDNKGINWEDMTGGL